MKWLGKIADPKDLTTKEYVDNADTLVQEAISTGDTALDKKKVNYTDITEYTAVEVQNLWKSYIK